MAEHSLVIEYFVEEETHRPTLLFAASVSRYSRPLYSRRSSHLLDVPSRCRFHGEIYGGRSSPL